jgi:hypothetical protein
MLSATPVCKTYKDVGTPAWVNQCAPSRWTHVRGPLSPRPLRTIAAESRLELGNTKPRRSQI